MRYRVVRLTCAFIFTFSIFAQIPGTNVNMVSGTSWPDGDPFLQRQNEPSIAVSSRNPLHLLAGANDYRTVDLPGLPNGETGDAWLGIFKSYDGGSTWKSTIHPGCAQNVAQCAGAPALKGYAAGADPVVRSGSNGMFYFAGIAFTRTSPAKSTVFVSRFIDNNNEENGDPIKYIDSVPVAAGSPTLFVDKPWIAVDIPRSGAATCSIAAPQATGPPVTQTFPGGNIYAAYATFTQDGKPPSQIQFARSTDCGATWSTPVAISDASINQGAVLAIDPASGAVYVAWRRFQSGSQLDAILIVKSTDGGRTFTQPRIVNTFAPFDQGTTDFSFRTNAYPTMAVDGAGRVYLAWAERNKGGPASGGDARIVLTTSNDGGQTWSTRQPVNDYPGRGHQIMPAMAFGGGKLLIIFYDLRDDQTTGTFTPTGKGQYTETRTPAGDLATVPPHPEKVFTQYVMDAAPADLNEGGLLRRHTVDVWAVQANPADAPVFSSGRVSQYIFGSLPGSSVVQQLQVNPPNFPLFSQGTVPFAGDYLDVAASPGIIPGAQPGTWKFNTDPSESIVFHAAWADNRDVRPPANGDWTDYTPPVSASTKGLSLFDPTKPQPSCITGQTGMRNENIYTSRITQGLTVSSPSNSKILGAIQRSFPVVVSNSTQYTRTYRLTIVNQPPGGKASFLQVAAGNEPDPLTVLDVSVAPISSISRMVFVTSSAALAPVLVKVAEVLKAGGNLRPGGLQGSVLLNPDPLTPANPAIAQNEIFNPAIANPAIANPAIANPAIANPAIANPAIANPAIANPAIANLSVSNADIANPAIANPAIANPAIANPAIANTAITDASWALSNNGNSAGTYSIHLLTDVKIPDRVLSQIIVNKVYTNPVAAGCSLVEQPQTVVLANVSNPAILPFDDFMKTNAGRAVSSLLRRQKKRAWVPLDVNVSEDSANPDITDSSLDDVTVQIGAGETIYITLRFFNTDSSQPLGFDPGNDITTVSVSHAIDTGGTQPPIASSHLIPATGILAPGVVGNRYDEFLLAAGGQIPYTWTLVSGSLPGGLTLSKSGEISGTITGTGGTYKFTVQVTDSSMPAGKPVQEALTLKVSSVGLAFSGVQAAGPGGVSGAAGQMLTVTATVVNSGGPADNVAPSIVVNSTGTAAAPCGMAQPASANIAQNGTQVFTFSCGPVSGGGTLSFSVSLMATDTALGAKLSVSPATSNTINLLAAPVVTVSAIAGGAVYTQGSWTNQNVTVIVTCTAPDGTATKHEITVTSEGANQSVNTACTDAAGNNVLAAYVGINIDKTPPVVTASATSGGAPYISGTQTNQPVVVTFTCTDEAGGSGVANAPAPQTIPPPAVGRSVTGTCTDHAGNVGTATFGGINITGTPPAMSVSYTSNGQPYAPGSWTGQPVTATFTCTPAAGLSVSNLTPSTTLTAEGFNQFVTGTCTDSAGNTKQISAGPINIELTPPQLTLQSLPKSASGWFHAPVTIVWQCADLVAGSKGDITRTVSSEGANQPVTATCSNLAGATVTDTETVSVDLTPPALSASPGAGASGWNIGAVKVTFSCSDALSGVAAGSPTGSTTVTGDTNGAVVNGSCSDVAGNTAQAAFGPVRIDSTAPAIAFLSATPPNSAGWNNGPVTVTWTCSDAGSGPVAATVAQTVTGDTANGSATGTCVDVAGNAASQTRSGIKIDTIPPSIRFSSPGDGATYVQGAGGILANYSCSDAGSSVPTDHCVGDVPPGGTVDISTPGTKTFTVTATDLAGNKTVVTHTYQVVAK